MFPFSNILSVLGCVDFIKAQAGFDGIQKVLESDVAEIHKSNTNVNTYAKMIGNVLLFEYFDFNSKHERVYRRNGKRYFVNPLTTIYDDDNYYLVFYYGKYEGVVHYRIGRMDHVQVVNDQPRDVYKGAPIDIKRHKKTLFGMFQGRRAIGRVSSRCEHFRPYLRYLRR